MSTDSLYSTSSARAFISTKGPQLSPAWDTTSCPYDPIRDKYVTNGPQSIRSVAAPHTERFIGIMEILKKEHTKDPSISKFDIRGAHDWDEVLLTAGMAREHYEARRKGFKGLITSVGRTLGQSSPALEAVANVLPNGDYTGIVCGGLTLILKAFSKMEKVRKQAMDELGDSPLLLWQVESFLKIYPLDKEVSEKAIQLYIALLVMLEEIVSWFDHGIWDRVKVVIQQDIYRPQMAEKRDKLRQCTQNLRDQVDICDKRQTVEIAKAIERLDQLQGIAIQKADENLAASAELSRQAGEGFRQMDDCFSSVRQGLTNVEYGVSDLRVDMNQGMSRIETAILNQVNANAANWLAKSLSSNEVLFEWQAKAKAAEAEAKAAKEEARGMRDRSTALESQLKIREEELQRLTPPPALTRAEVLQTLGETGDDASLAVGHYIRLARLHDEAPELTGNIMSSAHFRFWMGSSASQMLFVSPDAPLARISAGSFVTASLAQALRQLQPSITLVHFCRRHGSPAVSDPAAELLANLISQLLSAWEYDLTHWTMACGRRDHEDALRFRNLGYLCSLFKHLVTMLPYGAIFLLIDDFFYLEQIVGDETLAAVVQCLSELVQTCTARDTMVFKALIMTPNKKGRLIHEVDKRDLLRVHVHDQDNKEQMTSRQIKSRLERARWMGNGGQYE